MEEPQKTQARLKGRGRRKHERVVEISKEFKCVSDIDECVVAYPDEKIPDYEYDDFGGFKMKPNYDVDDCEGSIMKPNVQKDDAGLEKYETQTVDDDGEIDNPEDDVIVCDICRDAKREDLLRLRSRCIDRTVDTYCTMNMINPSDNGMVQVGPFKERVKKRASSSMPSKKGTNRKEEEDASQVRDVEMKDEGLLGIPKISSEEVATQEYRKGYEEEEEFNWWMEYGHWMIVDSNGFLFSEHKKLDECLYKSMT